MKVLEMVVELILGQIEGNRLQNIIAKVIFREKRNVHFLQMVTVAKKINGIALLKSKNLVLF